MFIKDLVCTNFRDHISLLNAECLLSLGAHFAVGVTQGCQRAFLLVE